MATEREPLPEQRIDGHITRGADGKYRWRYDVNLLTNLTFFFLVWKIFFFILLGISLIGIIADAVQWPASFFDGLPATLRFWGYFVLGMTALVAVGYLVYAAIMGGKYCVLFEMDENGVNHKQLPKQARKAEKIAGLTVLAGLAAGKPTVAGVGLNAARTEMYSDFSKVRRIKAYPRRRLIKVNGLLNRNQVYAEKEDFDFVLDYIRSHCPAAKK